MPGPLEGFRVLDISEVISGPLTSMILADQGADVIKVEPPGYGEEARQLANYRNGMAALFANCNHGKRSIGVDLKNDQGRELFYRMVRTADVVLQNWRPGAAERLRVGYDDLKKVKPDIVYASISGYGESGPYADRRGYDPIFQSLTGYVAAQVNPEIPIPDLVRNAVVDKATSYSLAQGITAALLARERGQGGQHVRIAMLDAGLSFFWPDGMLRHSLVGDDVENPSVPGERYQLMPTKDGQLILWMGTADQMRAGLRAVGRDDIADDPKQRGASMLEEPQETARAEAMLEGLAKLTTEEAYRRLVELEVPAAPVLQHPQVFEDPQIVHNGGVVEGEHPVYGRWRRARPSVRFTGTPAEPTPGPPLYGEQSEAILDELGLSEEEQQALREAGAVTA